MLGNSVHRGRHERGLERDALRNGRVKDNLGSSEANVTWKDEEIVVGQTPMSFRVEQGLDVETIAFFILFEDLEGLGIVENGGGLRVAVCVRHLDRGKSEIKEVENWRLRDSRRGLYELKMYRRRVEVSFSQVRREKKSKILWNVTLAGCRNDALRSPLGERFFRSAEEVCHVNGYSSMRTGISNKSIMKYSDPSLGLSYDWVVNSDISNYAKSSLPRAFRWVDGGWQAKRRGNHWPKTAPK